MNSRRQGQNGAPPGAALRSLCPGPVIPAARNLDDLFWALKEGRYPGVALLFGDINALPGLLAEAAKYGKRLIVHLDLLEGIGKDKAGVKCLARLGVTAIITTKSQLVKAAREEGMIVIQRLFAMDSEALKNGIKIIRNLKPDAVEILPASVPRKVIEELTRETELPVFAGGLVYSAEDVAAALASGAAAVSTSRRKIWEAMQE
ncbi:MAG: glycerol-3-phosphate responsive antiterminator [Negativicutes bacterium]|nr:glycerol-3-phosphate responsive antiterminator [Negativicutes bacterium]